MPTDLIRINTETKEKLDDLKKHHKDSYNDIIDNLIAGAQNGEIKKIS